MSTTPPSSTPSPPPTPPASGDQLDSQQHPRCRSGELDLRGEICPYTFVRTRLTLEALPLGARLTVAIDHASAAINLPRSLIEWGQEVTAVVADAPGRWRIDVVKRVE